jgi:hypothetical protein
MLVSARTKFFAISKLHSNKIYEFALWIIGLEFRNYAINGCAAALDFFGLLNGLKLFVEYQLDRGSYCRKILSALSFAQLMNAFAQN